MVLAITSSGCGSDETPDPSSAPEEPKVAASGGDSHSTDPPLSWVALAGTDASGSPWVLYFDTDEGRLSPFDGGAAAAYDWAPTDQPVLVSTPAGWQRLDPASLATSPITTAVGVTGFELIDLVQEGDDRFFWMTDYGEKQRVEIFEADGTPFGSYRSCARGSGALVCITNTNTLEAVRGPQPWSVPAADLELHGIVSDTVLLQDGTALRGLELESGQTAWIYESVAEDDQILSCNGGVILIRSQGTSTVDVDIIGLDAASGEPAWSTTGRTAKCTDAGAVITSGDPETPRTSMLAWGDGAQLFAMDGAPLSPTLALGEILAVGGRGDTRLFRVSPAFEEMDVPPPCVNKILAHDSTNLLLCSSGGGEVQIVSTRGEVHGNVTMPAGLESPSRIVRLAGERAWVDSDALGIALINLPDGAVLWSTREADSPVTTSVPAIGPDTAQSCEDITFTANSGDGAFDITTRGVPCPEAVELIWAVRDRHDPYGDPGELEVGEFNCRSTEIPDEVMPTVEYRCNDGEREVRWRH